MGRSKLPVILDESGEPFFGGDYEYRYSSIDVLREGTDAVVLAMGTVSGAAVAASDALRADGVSVAVALISAPLELDDETMRRIVEPVRTVMTVEDHSVRTGLGASVAEWMALAGLGRRLLRLGVDGYRSSGAAAELLRREGLDAEGIAAALRAALASERV